MKSKRHIDQMRFSLAVSILAAIAAWACVAALARGQIVITPDKPALHDPITATLNLGTSIPPGAKIRGSWECMSGKWLPCGDAIHLWVPAGKHAIRASGIWVLTKDVTVGTETFPVLIDFGQYDFRAEVLVGNGPVPPPPPPPPPGDKKQIVMFYSADQLDNYPQPQRSLLTSLALRQKLVAAGHQVLEILEAAAIPNTAGGPLAEFGKSVVGDALPRVALRPVSGGAVLDYALPADEAGLMKLLGEK